MCVRVQHSEAQQLTVLKEFPLHEFRLRAVRPTRGIPVEANSIHAELLAEAISGVNWGELAEDLLSRR